MKKFLMDHSIVIFAVLAAAAMMFLGVKGSIGLLIGELLTVSVACLIIDKKRADDAVLVKAEQPTDTE